MRRITMADKSDVVIEAFTGLAPVYEKTMDQELGEIWGLDYGEFVQRLMERVPAEDGGVVLDVATGTAKIPLALTSQTEARSQIVGLDITPAMLQQGWGEVRTQGLTARIRLVCGSAMAMPFVDQTFDLVICGLGMHHMDVAETLGEMRRVLKEGGELFLITVGALPSWRAVWRSGLMKVFTYLYFRLSGGGARAWAEVASFSSIHTAEEWQGVLAEAGFREIEITVALVGRRRWYPQALVMKAQRVGHAGQPMKAMKPQISPITQVG